MLESCFFNNLSKNEKAIVDKLIEIGQAERIFSGFKGCLEELEKVKSLIKNIVEIDSFYASIGGIKGYHRAFLKLLKNDTQLEKASLLKPLSINISNLDAQVKKYIDVAIDSLPLTAEIYPLGGAGDRLNLLDEKTKESLPQAKLNFMGKTLLEHLILGLKAREFLYFKKFKKRIVTPLVIMTSDVKNNDYYVKKLFEENNYFNRPVDSLFFIKQLSVPVINEEENWVLKAPLELELKPGGHGVLWSLMENQKIFERLGKLGRTKAIVRQINNPISSFDYNVLALSGYGFLQDKSFGFLACPRMENSAEGMIALKEKKVEKGYEYSLSNIEYTEFKKCGIEDSNLYSSFLSNTNTLFVDLKEVRKTMKQEPFPGMTINLKGKCLENGKELRSGRLECLMQALSDRITYFSSDKLYSDPGKVGSFVMENERRKTILAIKKPVQENLLETPLGAFFDMLQNYIDIFNLAKVNVPNLCDKKDFFEKGPSFLCYLNPLLGPVSLDISKKIRGGDIKKGSEFILDIGDVDIENIYLDGSLSIHGFYDDFTKMSRCNLKNVKIINSGVDWNKTDIYWQNKNKISRSESLNIVLNENSVFEAKDVVFEGPYNIEVAKNTKVIAFMKDNKVCFQEIFS